MKTKVVYIKTIGTCNLNCDHCFTNGSNGDPTQFDVQSTLTWLSNYAGQVGLDNDFHMELHGGEPFLVKLPKLREFTQGIRKIIPNVSIGCTSNLTFPLTDDHVRFIKDDLDGQIGTSWDPHIRWTTDTERQRWETSIRRLAAVGIYPKVNVTLTKRLIAEYDPPRFIETLLRAGVRRVELERLTMDGNAICSAGCIFPDNDEQDLWFMALLEYYQLYDISQRLSILTIDNLLSRLQQNIVHVGTNCRDCEQNLVTINSNGTLATCPNSATQVNYSSIHDDPAVFLSHETRVENQVKEKTWDERCLSCGVFDLCGGDCHQLHWDSRCGGWKRTLHKLSNRPYSDNLILKV